MKKLLFVFAIMFSFLSCGSTKDALNLVSNLKKVEVGMTKKEVVSILGKSYTPLGGSQTPNGIIETVGYDDLNGQRYAFHFLKGELVEWYKVDVFPPYARPFSFQENEP